MSYLDPYLVRNPQQIVSCDDLYNLWLRVRHLTGIDQISENDSDLKVSLLVKEMVPDVFDWQYGGDTGTHYIFKFHNHTHRQQAQSYLFLLGYQTETRDFIK